MGYIIYGGKEYEIEDRCLAHLKVTIATKFRREESFFLSWKIGSRQGSGRMSLWMTPGIPTGFRFSGSKPPVLNKNWLIALGDLADTPRGIVVISEVEAETYIREYKKVSA